MAQVAPPSSPPELNRQAHTYGCIWSPTVVTNGDTHRSGLPYRRRRIRCTRKFGLVQSGANRLAAGRLGNQRRRVRCSRRVRTLSAPQLGSYDGAAHVHGGGHRCLRSCGLSECSWVVGRLKPPAITRFRARGVAGADCNPGVFSRASCGSRTRPKTTEHLVASHRSAWPNPDESGLDRSAGFFSLRFRLDVVAGRRARSNSADRWLPSSANINSK